LSGDEASIDGLMRAYQGAVPGAGVAVLRGGAPPMLRAYGLADLENRVAATTASNYRLGSMTKQFTAAAILLLAEQGLLSVDDPVRRWLPTLPDAALGMTLRHLLTHSSGLADYEELIAEGTTEPLHDADVLRLLEAHNRRYFGPGSQYRYSNGAYVLLALIVERASGQGFASFLQERIFKPLGMRHTVALEAGVSAAHRAFGYSAAARGWTRTDQSLTSATLGDGGVYSSIEDLAHWDAALYDRRLLSSASLRLAFAPAIHSDDPAVQYGFGWRITGVCLWHSGETTGFCNVILRYPKHRFTVIVLTNRSEPQPYATALSIAGLYLPDAEVLRAAHCAAGPDPRARPLPR
jgi:CubicO group peptidase (beta-lactamase class C family)